MAQPGVPPSTFSATVDRMVAKYARIQPDALAVVEGDERWTYAQLDERVGRLASGLAARGLGRGDRVAILSENRHEYLEVELAAAVLGVTVACLNWRLADDELSYCTGLVTPSLLFVSPRFVERLDDLKPDVVPATITLGHEYEELLADAPAGVPASAADPEDGLVILYTSGTTGLPKGAVISHRAEVARLGLFCAEVGADRDDTYVAWAPMFHMASTDFSLITLMLGGKVIVCDGLDLDTIVDAVEAEPISWLIAMPGMVDRFNAALRERKVQARGVKAVGAMADLVPLHEVAELTSLVQAPYLNTFGSTEAGLAPASGNRIPVGEVAASLSKRESVLCDIRLVDPTDPEDRDVPDGVPGELALRGPTLFSGYWGAERVNAEEFRNGWFHTGDMFVRNPDGSLDFVDRVKYLIKTGGENVYPAEIERVLLADPGVADAVVVRRPDDRWGEVPVAFVARRDESVTVERLTPALRRSLAGYKQPKEIRFVAEEDLPRSTTGKIQRHEVEKWL